MNSRVLMGSEAVEHFDKIADFTRQAMVKRIVLDALEPVKASVIVPVDRIKTDNDIEMFLVNWTENTKFSLKPKVVSYHKIHESGLVEAECFLELI